MNTSTINNSFGENTFRALILSCFLLLIITIMTSCGEKQTARTFEVFETSASGKQLTKITQFVTDDSNNNDVIKVNIQPDQQFQTITGFGGSFTESSAYLLNQLSPEKRALIINAYFGKDGARYSLTRTHINSCDFSLTNYSYAPLENDTTLKSFSIEEDRNDIIPMIKDAMAVSEDGFKIIASPWTAPPWMKDNKNYVGGKLLPEYYDTWALFFSKYLDAYKKEGIDIWGLTVENEPIGNGNNWESMHYTPEEMLNFVAKHLTPSLQSNGHDKVKVLSYDQNRDELEEWAEVMYKDEETKKHFDGFAIHWYASTYDWFPDVLQHTHKMAPDKYLIQSEACVDAEVPHWQDDKWYWSKEATDWGWDWAPEEQKYLHPKYVPVYRYARDIIGCLNNWVDGWVDWNMVLDRQGGPNWFKNWCVAPVIVDPEKDEVYFTPLYYTMVHFSRFIRPGAVRIGFDNSDEDLMVTAAQNPDSTITVVLLNMDKEAKTVNLSLDKTLIDLQVSAQAIQTIVIGVEQEQK